MNILSIFHEDDTFSYAVGNSGCCVSYKKLFGVDEPPGIVERVRILPPRLRTSPLSELERQAAIGGSPLRGRYGVGLEEQHAHCQFARRMKVAHGIDPGSDTGVRPWAEGEYLKYVPWHVGVEPIVRVRSVFWQLVSIGFWVRWRGGCFRYAGWV